MQPLSVNYSGRAGGSLDPIPEFGVHRLRRQIFRQGKPNPQAILCGVPGILGKHGANDASKMRANQVEIGAKDPLI